MRYLIMLLLAGCMTPLELREERHGVGYASSQPPLKAAQCLARNAEEYRGDPLANIVSSWREGRQPGAYEVTARVGQGILLAVADVNPAAAGSEITIWSFSAPGELFGEISEAMRRGC